MSALAGGTEDTQSPWRQAALGPRARFFQAEADKFKTSTVRVVLYAPLSRESVTATALVPHLLGRGCRGYPDLTAVNRRLEELYGAGVGAGVSKLGEMQALFLGLDVVQGRYLPEEVLPGAMELLGRLCLEPAWAADGCFPADIVAQEKDNLANRIRGLYNDKMRYAALRCVEEMCAAEPYALSALGRLDDLPRLTPGLLTARWRQLVSTAPVDVFAVGGGDGLAQLVTAALGPLLAGAAQRPATTPGRPPQAPRRVVERDDVRQAKLCMGYRTAVTRADPRYAAMMVYTGILGAFPHSKLFRNVREKARLAYYASSQWDALKGILLVHCGIEPDRFEEAVTIITAQLEDISAGRIEDGELAFTKRGLANELRAAEDSPYAMLDVVLGQALVGDLRPAGVRIAEIETVTREQVVEVAQHVALDTIYLLTSAEGEEAPEAAAAGTDLDPAGGEAEA